MAAERIVSVIIPARNEGATIRGTLDAVLAQEAPGATLEVILVDDGSTDDTVARAREAGVRVLELGRERGGGNPAAARNRGAAVAVGDPLVFLDADCTVRPGWLAAILRAHDAGATVVGGALDLPPGLSWTARCDYYCGWYLIHSRRPAGEVPHHPPPNLSVRRDAFLATGGYTETPPLDYTNEERAWQAELRRAGHRIWFEPAAVAWHHNRPGFRQLLKRNYRWAYTMLESKSQSGSARMAWLYRYPSLLIAGAVPFAFAHTAFVVGCWTRAGVWEPVVMLPAILGSRFAYAAGMAVGGVQWLRRRGRGGPSYRPRWQ